MNKMIWLAIAVLAMGLVVLPETLSLFSGQHNWYTVGEVKQSCAKCHADVATEIAASPLHSGWGETCVDCHVTADPIDLPQGAFKSYANRTTQGFHAATIVACTDCHSGVAPEAYTPANFNTTTGTWKPHKNSLGSPNEAHKLFAEGAYSTKPQYYNNGTLKPQIYPGQSGIDVKGSNAACLACHTHVAVDIVWTKPTTMHFDADAASGEWIVDNFGVSGAVTYSTSGQ